MNLACVRGVANEKVSLVSIGLHATPPLRHATPQLLREPADIYGDIRATCTSVPPGFISRGLPALRRPGDEGGNGGDPGWMGRCGRVGRGRG